MFERTRVSSGGVGAALPAARRCAVLPILDLHRARLVTLQWGKKKKKIKKSTNSNFGFHIGLFGLPAERTSFGALADITVTTSYRGNTLTSPLVGSEIRVKLECWESYSSVHSSTNSRAKERHAACHVWLVGGGAEIIGAGQRVEATHRCRRLKLLQLLRISVRACV